MLKLLLPEQRKKIKLEYLKRYLSLIFIMLSAILILFAFSLTPTLLTAKSEESLLKEQVRIAKDPELNKDKIQLKETLTELNKTIEVLDVERHEISSIIDQITRNQIRGISISAISFEASNNKVSIQGTAGGREVLANFVSVLEEVEKFEKVELPFSSFTRNEDVPFSLNITLVSISPDTDKDKKK